MLGFYNSRVCFYVIVSSQEKKKKSICLLVIVLVDYFKIFNHCMTYKGLFCLIASLDK